MKKVTIYQVTIYQAYSIFEQGTGYSLNPWRGDDEYYKGYDDGGTDYVLPNGYSLAHTKDGELAIFDDNDNYCDIVNDDGMPILVSDEGYQALNKA